ncbi:O-antigen ligase family protein [Enterococcus hirae]|uniref:O-antigen ligase family protein n=1 Tax=Enterococcus TaxID=1350 RepID=UPI00159A5FF5|nr:O-antigen ligase family protein [Enterococcus hirae]QKX68117.1 O-antigen ligase family protein [Enterococcus hirae]
MKTMEANGYSSIDELTKSNQKILGRLFYLLGFTLCISRVFFGINMSISDVFMVLLVGYLLLMKKVVFSKQLVLFFIGVICWRLLSTILLSSWVDTSVSLFSVIMTGQKFFVNLLYLILTISILHINPELKKDFLSGVKVGTLFFGCLSMFIFLVAPASLKSFVLFGDLRLKGFMNDPNYFAYLQTCGYCIWYLRPFKGKWKNLIAFMGYTFCILLSASKTGVVAFLVINLLFLIQKLFRKNINVKHLVMTIMTASVLIIGTHFLFADYVSNLIARFLSIPQFVRFEGVFTNFYGAIVAGGSGRTEAWKTAQLLLTRTHFMGIGFVDYSSVALSVSGSPTIAHNTFLQIAVEWGIVPAMMGMLLVFGQFVRKLLLKKWLLCLLILANIIFSFSISLQNSRLLWILVGLLVVKEQGSLVNGKKEQSND